MKIVICFLSGLMFCLITRIEAQQIPDSIALGEGPMLEFPTEEEEVPATFFSSSVLEPMRLTLRHELSYKVKSPSRMVTNRSSFRLEYKNSFLRNFYIEVDSKLNSFWIKDHRAEAKDAKALFENIFIEAFLQFSMRQTSVKAGIQKMIWGESEAGAITDVISPRDYSELFFISLEESRRGQPMISVDQFTSIGDWTVFFVPFPVFNKYPTEKTEYYYDPFEGNASYQDEKSGNGNYEYGMKWKKTFGSSDVSFIAANLVDNDYTYNINGYTEAGQVLVTKKKQHFNIVGATFNYAFGDLILKGEAAIKSRKAYNDDTYQIIEKDAVDAALGVEYNPGGGSLSFFLEGVNNHVIGWNDEIQFVPQDIHSLVFTCRKTLFNQYLSLYWLTIYNEPYTGFLHELFISYRLNDNITLFLDGYYPDYKDRRNTNWIYRDQKQVDFKMQYQF